MSARAQITIEPLLVDFVPVRQAVGALWRDGAILDVLADDPGALLVAAAEEVAAIVMVRSDMFLALVIMLVCHQNPAAR